MKRLSIGQILIAVAVTIFVTGCYTTNSVSQIEREAAARPPQPSVDELRTHSFSAGRDRVFDAIVASIFEAGGMTETVDRASGVITTGWNSGGNLIVAALVGNYRTRHSFLVRDAGPDSSTVIFTMNIEMASGSQWIAVQPSRSNYSGMPDYWRSIEERLEGQITRR